MVPITAWLSEARNFSQEFGRPLVTLSYAQSLDGCVSTRRGVPTSISGPESMKLTHRMRAVHDAILVGIGTVLSDDPRLTVRLVEGDDPQPVVLDSNLRLPPDAQLLQGNCHPWIATAQSNLLQTEKNQSQHQKAAALLARGAQLLPVPLDDQGKLALCALLSTLADRGITSLMVEGGARVITSFLEQNLVDQIVLTIAPVILAGLPAVERDHRLNMQENSSEAAQIFARLREMGYDRSGQDLIVWGRLR
jgi:GTP cyclohydrolase II